MPPERPAIDVVSLRSTIRSDLFSMAITKAADPCSKLANCVCRVELS